MSKKNEKNPIIKWVEERDVFHLCWALFDEKPTEKQREIIKDIAFRLDRRLCITAYTRYGKTWAVALGTALFLFLHDDVTVNEIAPVGKQSKKFRRYLMNFILECEPLRDALDVNATGYDRIMKEVSKKRVTFRDGSEVNIMTAGGSNKAQSLMGSGGDLVIVDESCDIDQEVFDMRISRMLGDAPETSMLVEIGNPWKKTNHFYKHWDGDRFKSIKIGWRQGVREGRTTKEFIMDQKSSLPDMKFKVLYEADFPDSTEGGLLKESWIKDAEDRELSVPWDNEDIDVKRVYGLDVAAQGDDLSVLTEVLVWEDLGGNTFYKVSDVTSWQEADTEVTAKRVNDRMRSGCRVMVDIIGVGKGVADKLARFRDKVSQVNVGKSASDKENFIDKKAEYYWNLRDVFEQGRIDLVKRTTLKNQLAGMRYEYRGRGKTKVLDPDKSPDFADSLMLALSEKQEKVEMKSLENPFAV